MTHNLLHLLIFKSVLSYSTENDTPKTNAIISQWVELNMDQSHVSGVV